MGNLTNYIVWIILFTASIDAKSTKHELEFSSDCRDVVLDTGMAILSWNGTRIHGCNIKLLRDSYHDNELCVHMESHITKESNSVKLLTSKFVIKNWDALSPSSSRDCLYIPRDLYLQVNTEPSPGDSFTVKIFHRDRGVYNIDYGVKGVAKKAAKGLALIIGIVVGLFVLVIILVVVIVCICCRRGRR